MVEECSSWEEGREVFESGEGGEERVDGVDAVDNTDNNGVEEVAESEASRAEEFEDDRECWRRFEGWNPIQLWVTIHLSRTIQF